MQKPRDPRYAGVATYSLPWHRAHRRRVTDWEGSKMRGILVFLIILLAGGGLFWALVGGCVAS